MDEDTAGIHAAAFSALREDRGLAPEDVVVVRTRQVGDDAVVAVTFTGRTGGAVRGFVGARRRDGRWRGAGGWSGGVREVAPDELWAGRGGWWNNARGAYGGWVNDPAAATARITTADGRMVEDVVRDGLAILLWQGPFAVRDAVVDLLGADGRVLRSAPMHPPHPES